MREDVLQILDKAEVLGFGVVRDKDGNPKVDDPSSLPAEILAQLTPQERATLEAM